MPKLQRQEELGDVDLLNRHVAGDQSDGDREVDEIEDVVLQVEHRYAEVRNEKGDGADEREPRQMPDSLWHRPRHRLRVDRHSQPLGESYDIHCPSGPAAHRE
jgi:hypothetical protein